MLAKLREMDPKKRLTVLICAAILLCVILGTGGWLIWRAIALPDDSLRIDHQRADVVRALYSQKNEKKTKLPNQLNELLGAPEDTRLVPNGSLSLDPMPGTTDAESNGKAKEMFANREWILTDLETYNLLHTDASAQRSLQVRAMIKLALLESCERVKYSIEYVELPQGDITTVAQYLAAHEGEDVIAGKGGYTLEYSAEWATQALGRDIKSCAADRDTFESFMKELKSYQPVQATVIPGAGR